MTFDQTVKELHEFLGTTNRCYIVNCGENPEVKVLEIRTGVERFYCLRCALELIDLAPNFFQLVRANGYQSNR